MVLPGIQALFGFQMIAVFNQRYVELPPIGNTLHLASLILIALAIALIMAPASCHRLAETGLASRRLICAAMIPLMLDIVAVCLFMTAKLYLSMALALSLFCVSIPAWFVFPLTVRRWNRK